MKFDRVEGDIAAGRLWKARDRLQGMRMHAPHDQEVLERLGAVAADMGDLPAAGLAWFLTDGDDPRRDDAFRAMYSRHRGPQALARALRVRAPVDAFPAGARERLRELEPHLPHRRPEAAWPAQTRRQKVMGAAGCLGAFMLFALVFVIPWLHGVSELWD